MMSMDFLRLREQLAAKLVAEHSGNIGAHANHRTVLLGSYSPVPASLHRLSPICSYQRSAFYPSPFALSPESIRLSWVWSTAFRLCYSAHAKASTPNPRSGTVLRARARITW